MPYNLDDFKTDALRVMLEDPWETGEERAALSAVLLEDLDSEQRLRGLSPEERLRGLPPEDILHGMDPEQVKAWLKRTRH